MPQDDLRYNQTSSAVTHGEFPLNGVVDVEEPSRTMPLDEPRIVVQSLLPKTVARGNVILIAIVVGGTLSCVTTLFAEGDVLSSLLAFFYQGESAVAAAITEYVVPSITTVPINGVLRGSNFARAVDNIISFFSGQMSCSRFLEAVKFSLPYSVPAILTAGVDVYIGVYTSSRARALLSPLLLKMETVLSFIYMLPIDFLGLYDLSGRIQRFIEKMRGIDDRQQVYERGMAVYAFLKNLSPEEQINKLGEIISRHTLARIQCEHITIPSSQCIKTMPRKDFDNLVTIVCQDQNLNDGSSLLSQIAVPVSLGVAATGGTATLYSPVENVYLAYGLPAYVGWPLGGVSGGTKWAFYAVSHDTLFRFCRLGAQLFPSRPARIATTLIASVAGLGFWQVGSHAAKGLTDLYASLFLQEDITSTGLMPWYAQDPDSRGVEEPPDWFYVAVLTVLLNSFAANTASCFNLLLRIIESNRQDKNGFDHAAAFLARSNEILTTPKKRGGDEENLLRDTDSTPYGSVDTTLPLSAESPQSENTGRPVPSYSPSSACFFQDQQPRRRLGIARYVEGTFERLLGLNF